MLLILLSVNEWQLKKNKHECNAFLLLNQSNINFDFLLIHTSLYVFDSEKWAKNWA